MLANEPELGREVMADLLELAASGKLKSRVSARYSMDDAPIALRTMMDRKAIGKIVIEP